MLGIGVVRSCPVREWFRFWMPSEDPTILATFESCDHFYMTSLDWFMYNGGSNSKHVRIWNGPKLFSMWMVLFLNGWDFLDTIWYCFRFSGIQALDMQKFTVSGNWISFEHNWNKMPLFPIDVKLMKRNMRQVNYLSASKQTCYRCIERCKTNILL